MNWRSPPNHLQAEVIWHRIIRTEGAFVREEAFGGVVEYGPMPQEMMVPLIEERRAVFQGYAEKLKAGLIARYV
jgi:hypothetical protein